MKKIIEIYDKTLTFRLTSEQLQKLKKYSKKEKETMTDSLRKYINKLGEK